jgi:molybdate transport system ATP-binding protein
MNRVAARGRRRLAGDLEIVLDGLNLHRDERRVLERICWHLRPGQRWVVLGENGAGKTQLLRLIAGQIWPDPRRRGRAPPIEYRSAGERSPVAQFALRRIAYLGPELQDRYARMDWNHTAAAVVGTGVHGTDIPLEPMDRATRRNVARLMGLLGIAPLARRRFLTLSFGERRLVLLARALAGEPDWLLADELLAGLDPAGRAGLLRWFESRAGRARSWVLSTHRAEEVPRSATHVLALRAGRIVRRGLLPRAWHRGRRVGAPGLSRIVRRTPTTGAPLLELRRASVYLGYQPALRRIDLAVHAGECWVIHGPIGSGKSTLLRAMHGDFPAAAGGAILRRGIEPGVPIAQFRDRCALLGPHLQSEYPRATSVRDVVVSGLRSSYGLDEPATAAESAAATLALREVGASRLAARALASLSYGQARRVMFARALVRRPELLLLDEPFCGIDAPTRAALLRRVERLAARGGAVVIATHHADERPRCASHELELLRGQPVYAGPLRVSAARGQSAGPALGRGRSRGAEASRRPAPDVRYA